MRGIENLNPKVKIKALALQELALSSLKLRIIFLDTLRTELEQQAYYAQGRKTLAEVNKIRWNAKMQQISAKENLRTVTNASSAKLSWHGYGLAFDIAVVDATGKQIIWDKRSDWNGDGKDDWAQVGTLAEKIGLEWGGNFTSLYDAPHYQDRMGLTIAQVQSKFKSGQIASI